MKGIYRLIFSIFVIAQLSLANAQNNLGLHVTEGKTVLFGRDTTFPGIKAFWLPSKAAFRAGIDFVGEDWTYENIGFGSFATGNSGRASGRYSTVIGSGTATGFASTAMSGGVTSGDMSTAMSGGFTTGISSTAIGRDAVASGDYSTAIGGRVSTGDQQGSLILGDSDPLDHGRTVQSTPNEMVCRF